MRLAPLLLSIAFLAAATPAGAAKSEYAGSAIFGTGFCKPTFACPSLSSSEAMKALTPQVISIASSCVSRKLGLNSRGGFFETSLGLDSSLCLTTKKLPKEETGLTMTPRCCVKPVGNTRTCQVVCMKYGVR